ncbi:hypothetical protein Avbf_14689, partial [Armadillidium vulgare]
MAGSETTSSTIRWFFLYMSRFPDVQKRFRKRSEMYQRTASSLHDKENCYH